MRVRHEFKGECPLCLEMLKGCHPRFLDMFTKLKAQFPLVHISSGYRGKDEQNALVKAGASSAVFPNSSHNKIDEQGLPKSRAIDLFELTTNGWDAERFKLMAEYLFKINEPLKKPYPLVYRKKNGKLVRDFPHFELSLDII